MKHEMLRQETSVE